MADGQPPRILGIDPSISALGWALMAPYGVPEAYGEFRRRPKRGDHPGARWAELERYLRTLMISLSPDEVVVEDVRRHAGSAAAHAYGGVVAVLALVTAQAGVPLVGLPVRAAPGAPSQKRPKNLRDKRKNRKIRKAASVAAAKERWPDLNQNPLTDNEADAMWLAERRRLGEDDSLRKFKSPASRSKKKKASSKTSTLSFTRLVSSKTSSKRGSKQRRSKGSSSASRQPSRRRG